MLITDLLDLLQEEIENINPVDQQYLRSRGNDNGFEKLFPVVMHKVLTDLDAIDRITFKVHTGHHFPDVDIYIDDIKYGVELKSRNDGSWTTNGNSVLESITSDDYKSIYLMFGSKVRNENRIKVKYAPYWRAVSDIKVTHSPRFIVDMRDNESYVFESEVQYETLRHKNPEDKINFLQDYLKKNTSGTKWYTSSSEGVAVNKFNELDKDKQNQLRAEVCILFPDDLLIGKRNTKYERSTKYLLNRHFAYTPSFRDLFSSGGKSKISGVEFPQVINSMFSLSDLILKGLNEASEDFAYLARMAWKQNLPEELLTVDLITSYKRILDYIGLNEKEPNEELPYKVLLEQANISKLSNLILDAR